jgi:hypothetical protein
MVDAQWQQRDPTYVVPDPVAMALGAQCYPLPESYKYVHWLSSLAVTCTCKHVTPVFCNSFVITAVDYLRLSKYVYNGLLRTAVWHDVKLPVLAQDTARTMQTLCSCCTVLYSLDTNDAHVNMASQQR